jgi:NADH-quinone oxidoreductase subunit A
VQSALASAVFSIVAAALTGPKRYNRAKRMPMNVELNHHHKPAGGGKFPVKYFLTAMLFIVFDIEIVFLYPWAVLFDQTWCYSV